MTRRFILSIAVLCLSAAALRAQISVGRQPVYYITGIPLEGAVDKTTADVKFQYSLDLKLLRNIAGKEGLDLSLRYAQRSVWHFYDKSSPFKDNIYMPGFYLGIPTDGNRLLVGLEHRSNGRPYVGSGEDPFSRSVNFLSCEYTAFFGGGLVLQASLRAGIAWYDEDFSQEMFRSFLGYGDLAIGYQKPGSKWQARLSVTPLIDPGGANVTAELARRLGFLKLFTQFHYGYDEALSDCLRGSRPAPYLRFGILFGDLF